MTFYFFKARILALCLLFTYARAELIDGLVDTLMEDVTTFFPPLNWVPHSS
jgi:hypothetical protein